MKRKSGEAFEKYNVIDGENDNEQKRICNDPLPYNPPTPSPSNSSKISEDRRLSPASTVSKYRNTEYDELDGKGPQTTSPVKYNMKKEDQIELESLRSMAADELSKRPKTGLIYKEIRGLSTKERLKDLSNEKPSIDVGIEIADGAYLLKLVSVSINEIETAAEKAHKGAMLLLQAEMLRKKGEELLAQSQTLLRSIP